MITNAVELLRELRARAEPLELHIDVNGSGPLNATVAVVGEAPGEREKATGMPFMGGAGQLLWDALKKINLKRSDVYATNVVKRQLLVHSDRNAPDEGKVHVQRNELSNWQLLLKWELAQLPNLRYVVLLGGMALEALTSESGITNWRGSVIPIKIGDREVHAIVSFNPAFPLREPRQEIVFRFDIGRLGKIMERGYTPPIINPIINPTYEDAYRWIDKMQDEKKPVALDIEVISDETACIGLGNTRDTAMCINLRDRHHNRYSVAQERSLLQRFQRLFDDPNTRIVAQNGSFDSYFLWCRDRLQIRKIWFDTLLAHHCLYPSLPHNLGFITAQYTDHPFYKDEKNRWKEGGNIDDFWIYNVKDCCITLAAHEKLLAELKSQMLDKFFFEHVMRLQPHLVRMTVGGMKVDTELKERIAGELREEVARLIVDFHNAVQLATGDADYRPSPRSPAQLRELFFGRLKLVGRGISVDATNRKRMLDHHKTDERSKNVIRVIDKFKKEDKFLGTYAEMTIDDDERIRCDWKQYGTVNAPGRLSSSSVMWGSGTNLQNQPQRAYAMFIADPGYELFYFDLSQAEARYVGWEANIPKWKEQFERARLNPGAYDCHRALAAEMWGIPYDDVPSKDRDADGNVTKRFTAKRCRHGLNYRMGPDRLAETTGLPLNEAHSAYNIYHRITPELRKWWSELEQEVKRTKMLFNAFGRRLFVLERIDENSLESIVAFKPQSSIGDKVSSVIYLSESDDNWPRHARILLNVHDALVGIARKDVTKTALSICKRYAEAPIMVRGEPLIIPADCTISVAGEDGVHRWSTLKEVHL
jgi:uracil-DNA glycosylase family 4